MKFRFDKKQNEAAARLINDPNFRVMLGALGDYGEELMRQVLFARDDVEVLRGQGQLLTMFMEAVNEAPAKLEQFEQPQT